MKLQEYKDHDFCKSVDCMDLISKVHNDGFVEECSVYQSSCNYTAKYFYIWLTEHGYKITKEVKEHENN